MERAYYTLVLLTGLLFAAGLSTFSAYAYERASLRSFDAREQQTETILIRTQLRRLYLLSENGISRSYAVAVGKPGKQWYGIAFVDGKYINPAWSPPPEVKRDNPSLPRVIPGGSPSNPMGPRALTLTGDQYAIHGTNHPESIGKFASYGCIRMRNADIVDLFEHVRVGTKVVVTP